MKIYEDNNSLKYCTWKELNLSTFSDLNSFLIIDYYIVYISSFNYKWTDTSINYKRQPFSSVKVFAFKHVEKSRVESAADTWLP